MMGLHMSMALDLNRAETSPLQVEPCDAEALVLLHRLGVRCEFA